MKISVLVSARKNSKYLAKFLHVYFMRTTPMADIECLVMMNEGDTWNTELVEYYNRVQQFMGFYGENQPLRFYKEDLGLGRAGLHEYFNELYKHATGDWIVYFCEDHSIIMDGWDDYIRQNIEERGLDHMQPYCIVPVFDNAGSMNHILSRGYCKAIGDRVGGHGWIDSWINDVNWRAFGDRSLRLIRNLDTPMFHDFTHDQPTPMDDAHLQSVISEAGKKLPRYADEIVKQDIERNGQIIRDRIGR